MNALVAVALAFGATALAAAPRKRAWERGGVWALAASAAGGSIREWGLLRGAIVFLVIAMTAASTLVLVLPPRPALARPAAGAFVVLGALLWAIAP